MKTRMVFGIVFMMFVLVQTGIPGGKGDIQKYFNDTAVRVKAATDPEQKRAILDKSLQTMSQALEKVEKFSLVSQNDRLGVNRFKMALKAKQDELKGLNGYERVADSQLNAFSDYVVQDMEQAERYVTISIVTVILVVIILLLL